MRQSAEGFDFAHHRAGGGSGGVPVKLLDQLLGQKLVAAELLTAEQLKEALAAQKQFRARGIEVRIGEVLVGQGLLSHDQVGQFLQETSRELLLCPSCKQHYVVKGARPGKQVFCPRCSVVLGSPGWQRTLDAEPQEDLPVVQASRQTGEACEDARDQTSKPALPDGRPFGRYRLIEQLGEGAMGVVWKAWDTELHRTVALKVLSGSATAGPQLLERFLREAQFAAKLRHPHIATVYDVGEHEGQHYLTAEYVPSQPLDRVLEKPVPLKKAVRWVKEVAEALAYAHEQGIVHRDVKPSNILIGEDGKATLVDFGLAREVEMAAGGKGKLRTLTVTGAILGTPPYMSPEHASGRKDLFGPPSDQFSLGSVLYELLTGRRPFEGNTLSELLSAISHREPLAPRARNRRVPRDVETICLKALEKDPRRRYATMGDLAADLDRYFAGETIHARPVSRTVQIWRSLLRRRTVVLPTLAAALLAATFGAWLVANAYRKSAKIRDTLRDAHEWEQEAKFDMARGAYRVILDLDPGHPEATSGYERTDRKVTELAREQERKLVQAQAEKEAFSLLEAGRPALDQASRYLYHKDAVYEEFVKRVEQGQGLIERALERAPHLALAHHLLGRAWELRGWLDKAEASWRKAIALDPAFGSAHYQLGRLLSVRSFLAALGPESEQRGPKLHEAQRLAEEASQELAAALRAVELDDPLQRELARAMLAFAKRDANALQEITQTAIQNFSSVDGVEEFHWLSGLLRPIEETREASDRAIAIRPHHWLALFVRGYARQRLGDLDGAIADYTRSFENNPRSVWACLNRGVAHGQKSDWQTAIVDFNEALRIDPRSSDALVNRGRARQETGDLDGALADYAEALKWSPGAVMALNNRATVFAKQNRLREALADLDEAVRINPEHVDGLLNRGIVRRELGDLDGAMADFTEAVRRNPRLVHGYVSRANIYAAKGAFDQAIVEYGRAIEVDPRFAPAYYNRGTARREKGDFDGAIADFDKAIEIDPRYSDAIHNRGIVRWSKGDFDGAIGDYDKALEIAPGNPDTLSNRGVVRLAKDDLDGALEDFNAALKANPAFAAALENRGHVRRMRGELDGAIADYTAALRIQPNDAGLLRVRGAAHAAKGDHPAAATDFQAALHLNSRDAEAWNALGALKVAQGNLDGAIADFTEALRHSPRDPVALGNRAKAFQDKGDLPAALLDCREALRATAPDFPLREEVEQRLRTIEEILKQR